MMLEQFPRSLPEFDVSFATEESCWNYLFKVRWPEGWHCPRCASLRGWRNQRALVECAQCGHQTSLTAGTIFHASKKPLRLWFKAIFLLLAQKNGLSAKSLANILGLSYPTAWTWLQKLRRCLGARSHAPLSGVVEVDDSYLGGYRQGQPGRRKGGGNKDLIMVAVEDRGEVMGRARIVAVPDHLSATFTAAVAAHLQPGSTVITDGLSSYQQLPGNGYDHRPKVIGKDKKGAGEALPRVHRVISLVKRWLLGTHQGSVSRKHLPAYLEEFEFRFNRRRATHRTLLFERFVEQAMRSPHEPYRLIIAAHPQPVVVT